MRYELNAFPASYKPTSALLCSGNVSLIYANTILNFPSLRSGYYIWKHVRSKTANRMSEKAQRPTNV